MYRNYMQKRTCGCSNKNMCEEKNNDIIKDNYANVVSYNAYDSCECGFDEENQFPQNPMFAQSYVPWQVMDKTFVPEVGLKMGTIFPELVSPYMPGDSMKQNEYIKNTNNIKEGCNK